MLAERLAGLSPAFLLRSATVRLAGTGLQAQWRFEEAYERHFNRSRTWYIKEAIAQILRSVHPAKYGSPGWDLSEVPRFQYRATWPTEEIRASLIDLAGLVLFGALALTGAAVRFTRYDCR